MLNLLRCSALLLAVFSLHVEARMYQWLDAETGTTQLSGKPPAWYRTGERGPRVFVFESGQLVDDTGIRVSEEQRELLRQRSFDIANEQSVREKARAILSKRDTLIEEQGGSLADDLDESVEQQQVVEQQLAEEEVVEEEVVPTDLSGLSQEDMKQLILDWEEAQKQKAREIINN